MGVRLRCVKRYNNKNNKSPKNIVFPRVLTILYTSTIPSMPNTNFKKKDSYGRFIGYTVLYKTYPIA